MSFYSADVQCLASRDDNISSCLSHDPKHTRFRLLQTAFRSSPCLTPGTPALLDGEDERVNVWAVRGRLAETKVNLLTQSPLAMTWECDLRRLKAVAFAAGLLPSIAWKCERRNVEP